MMSRLQSRKTYPNLPCCLQHSFTVLHYSLVSQNTAASNQLALSFLSFWLTSYCLHFPEQLGCSEGACSTSVCSCKCLKFTYFCSHVPLFVGWYVFVFKVFSVVVFQFYWARLTYISFLYLVISSGVLYAQVISDFTCAHSLWFLLHNMFPRISRTRTLEIEGYKTL